jgi:hypothetical protein
MKEKPASITQGQSQLVTTQGDRGHIKLNPCAGLYRIYLKTKMGKMERKKESLASALQNPGPILVQDCHK